MKFFVYKIITGCYVAGSIGICANTEEEAIALAKKEFEEQHSRIWSVNRGFKFSSVAPKEVFDKMMKCKWCVMENNYPDEDYLEKLFGSLIPDTLVFAREVEPNQAACGCYTKWYGCVAVYTIQEEEQPRIVFETLHEG